MMLVNGDCKRLGILPVHDAAVLKGTGGYLKLVELLSQLLEQACTSFGRATKLQIIHMCAQDQH